MHDTARHLMGELNTRIALVEQLVRDAQAAAERLRRQSPARKKLAENAEERFFRNRYLTAGRIRPRVSFAGTHSITSPAIPAFPDPSVHQPQPTAC